VFVPAHLDGAGHLGEVFLGGKAIDLETWIDFEGLQFFRPGKGNCWLRVTGGRRRVLEDWSRQVLTSLPVATVLWMAGVAIGDHEIEVRIGGEEVEVAIGFVAPASVVEGVERAVAIVKLGGFIDDELPEVFVESGGVFFEESLEGDICELVVPMDVILMPINCSLIELTGDDLGLGAIKDVAETDGVLFRSFGKSLGVKCEVFVVSITGINGSDVLTGYGRKKDNLGERSFRCMLEI
jgi:hypothetical protein